MEGWLEKSLSPPRVLNSLRSPEAMSFDSDLRPRSGCQFEKVRLLVVFSTTRHGRDARVPKQRADSSLCSD
jgi:hypothetical protein